MENNHQPRQRQKPEYIYCQTKHQAATWACDTSAFLFSGLTSWDVTFNSLFELWDVLPNTSRSLCLAMKQQLDWKQLLESGQGAVWLSVIVQFNDNIADHTA